MPMCYPPYRVNAMILEIWNNGKYMNECKNNSITVSENEAYINTSKVLYCIDRSKCNAIQLPVQAYGVPAILSKCATIELWCPSATID